MTKELIQRKKRMGYKKRKDGKRVETNSLQISGWKVKSDKKMYNHPEI